MSQVDTTVYYVRDIPFLNRQRYAQQIRRLPGKIPVVVTCSLWFPQKYECLILDARHTVSNGIDWMTTQFELPPRKTSRIAVFDPFTNLNITLDTNVHDLTSRSDKTVYLHVVYI